MASLEPYRLDDLFFETNNDGEALEFGDPFCEIDSTCQTIGIVLFSPQAGGRSAVLPRVDDKYVILDSYIADDLIFCASC